MLVAESPVYLLLKYGERENKKAIRSLNYIAAFNGADFRVPEDAIIEVDTPQEKDGEDLSIGELILNATKSVATLRVEGKDAVPVLTRVKTLLLSGDINCSVHYRLKVLRIVCMMVYYVVLFNMVEFAGDPLLKGLLFGISESMGVLLVERVAKITTDIRGFNIAFPFIVLMSTMLKLDIPEHFIYICFCL